MKRMILLVLTFLSLGQWANAQNTDKHFEIDAMGGLAFSSVTQDTGTISGEGGGIDGYYLLNPHLGIGASIGYHEVYYDYGNYIQSSKIFTNFTFGFLDFLAMGKYRFGDGGFRPYLIGGAGICSYTIGTILNQYTGEYTTQVIPNSKGSVTSIYPEVSGGVGLEIALFADMNIFAQGKYDLVFFNNSTTFCAPVEGGVNLLL